jgi:Fe-S cluster assembly protein SufB
MKNKKLQLQSLDDYKYGFFDESVDYVIKSRKGIDEQIVRQISGYKKEPKWMLKNRLDALAVFKSKPLPKWGPDLSKINFDNLYYYMKPTEKKAKNWDDLPSQIKKTYDFIGVPEAEKKILAGVEAQYDSEVVYGAIKKTLSKKGVIFTDTDTALKKYPELVQKYFGSIIPSADNKFSALNTSVWSGGSFIYIPKNTKVELPLQAYFRINAASVGQFERTLIIADEGSFVQYVEGCTAPIHMTDSLHSAVVEVIVKRGARVRYTTIQNWSNNVYNLVTKRMRIEEEGIGEWIDGNLGSKVTMKYPSCFLVGKGATGEILSIAYSGEGQHQDAGGKIIHAAPFTSSKITSKSISKGGGRATYRGLIYVSPKAKRAKSKVVCDALILDPFSRSDTYPTMRIRNDDTQIEHEATVSKIGEEQLFYLLSRGLKEEEAQSLIVNGFIEPFVKELPLEYAVEMNRLIRLQMQGSVG